MLGILQTSLKNIHLSFALECSRLLQMERSTPSLQLHMNEQIDYTFSKQKKVRGE